jgi:hypothetical protein
MGPRPFPNTHLVGRNDAEPNADASLVASARSQEHPFRTCPRLCPFSLVLRLHFTRATRLSDAKGCHAMRERLLGADARTIQSHLGNAAKVAINLDESLPVVCW